MLRDVASPEFRHVPFGGILMLFGGYWTQFLPVVPCGTKQEVLDETLKCSYMYLKVYQRVETGEEYENSARHRKVFRIFKSWLRLVADGAIQVGPSSIALPDSMVLPSEEAAIEWIYTPAVLSDMSKLREVALLGIRNNEVLNINEVILSELGGETISARGIDEAVREDDGIDGMPYENEEYFHREPPQGMPPYLLELKVGCIIMLLRNMDVANQLRNGTRSAAALHHR
ncbi:hypothetical protein Y032_0565g14 [Ancylostoma ceylanicum]|uniref:ATP-dependent DNA helicase n=1 Tax=Ancylostoma ceylanicum TaxID=53326 RepID=A0A016WPJ0_9BILA|nr:hypothetical protein Y032_0565g14 [Ancylostoma ceylanicum]